MSQRDDSIPDLNSPEFTRIIASIDSAVWDGAQVLLTVLKESADAFPPLKSAVGGFLAILDLYKTTHADTDAINDTAFRLNRLMRILAERLRDKEKASMFMDDIYVRHVNLSAALHRLVEMKKKNWFFRAAQSVRIAQEIQTICNRVAESIEELQLKIGISVEKDTKAILQEAILQNLSRARSAAYTASMPPDGVARRSCAKDTRVNIVESIISWARADWSARDEVPPIYWISGLAGQGKTTIAYTICERLQKEAKEVSMISFFCSRQLDSHEGRLLVPTLAFRLAERSASYASALLNNLKSAHDLGDQRLEVQISGLLLEPWQKSAHLRAGLLEHPIVIVVDAPDENDAGTEFIRQISLACRQKKLPGLRILITSRPHPTIEKLWSHPENERAVYRLNDVSRAMIHDEILTYMREELHEYREEDYQYLEHLARIADGLFIHASTALRLLMPLGRRLAKVEQTNRLKAIIKRCTAESSGSSNGILDDLYADVMAEAFKKLDREEENVRSRILVLLLCSSEAIHPDFVTIMERVDADLVQLVIDALYAVMYIGREGQVLWHHASFQEYILAKYKFMVKPMQVHIVRRCWEEFTHHLPEKRLLSTLGWGVHPLMLTEATIQQFHVDDIIRRCQILIRGFRSFDLV
ncbi:hypothetical protein PENSPDRAFT_679523 [Peniophora sp. CONT]|nr:hypothetical protein PENSPDRAFT_679523 [Peniophora sp. CONT]